MGCPARNVINGQSGSALMRDLDHALTLIDATALGLEHRVRSAFGELLARGHFGHDETGSQPGGEPPERRIRDPRHRGQHGSVRQRNFTHRNQGGSVGHQGCTRFRRFENCLEFSQAQEMRKCCNATFLWVLISLAGRPGPAKSSALTGFS